MVVGPPHPGGQRAQGSRPPARERSSATPSASLRSTLSRPCATPSRSRRQGERRGGRGLPLLHREPDGPRRRRHEMHGTAISAKEQAAIDEMSEAPPTRRSGRADCTTPRSRRTVQRSVGSRSRLAITASATAGPRSSSVMSTAASMATSFAIPATTTIARRTMKATTWCFVLAVRGVAARFDCVSTRSTARMVVALGDRRGRWS
jgi:hypothetical protein